MLSGFNFTEARCPVQPGDRLHVVYMDDRSWTAKQVSVLLQTLRAWHDFSRRAGLRENEAKTQITYKDAERHRELQHELADDPVLSQAAVVLGCCTTGTLKGRPSRRSSCWQDVRCSLAEPNCSRTTDIHKTRLTMLPVEFCRCGSSFFKLAPHDAMADAAKAKSPSAAAAGGATQTVAEEHGARSWIGQTPTAGEISSWPSDPGR